MKKDKEGAKYNVSEHGSYDPMVSLSPYARVDGDRLKQTKFVFRKAEELSRVIDNPRKLIDVGSANGEFLHFLNSQSRLAATNLIGIEVTPEFVSVAESLLANTRSKIIEADVFSPQLNDLRGDIVTCLGTFPIFPDPTAVLNRLIEFASPGGIIIIDGRFNPNNISIITKYSDDSKAESSGVWRCDFNTHSEKSIQKILASRDDVEEFRFEYFYIDSEIPRNISAPSINMWTEQDVDGNFRIINGMGAFFDPAFLIIKKSF